LTKRPGFLEEAVENIRDAVRKYLAAIKPFGRLPGNHFGVD
jgi:hypothetical protein